MCCYCCCTVAACEDLAVDVGEVEMPMIVNTVDVILTYLNFIHFHEFAVLRISLSHFVILFAI